MEIFKLRPFWRWLWNSTAIAICTTVLSLLLALPAGYSLGRFRFRGKGFFALTALVTQMLPASLIVVPLYIVYLNLGLLESKWGVILASSMTLLLYMDDAWFFGTVPREVEDAAMVDGCSSSGIREDRFASCGHPES